MDKKYWSPKTATDQVRIHFRKLVNEIKNATDAQLEKIQNEAYTSSSASSKSVDKSKKLVPSKSSGGKMDAKLRLKVDQHLMEFKATTDRLMLKTKQEMSSQLFVNSCTRNIDAANENIENIYAEIQKEAENLVFVANQIIEKALVDVSAEYGRLLFENTREIMSSI